MPIDSRPDHVAVAVPDLDPALVRWRDDLDGVVAWDFDNPAVFRGATLRYAGGAKLEVLAPSTSQERIRSTGGPTGFLEGYLDRFGASVHHLTLKVPDLSDALHDLGHADVEAVDVDLSDPHWREAFVGPRTVGGLVVQLAETDRTDEQWAAAEGSALPPVPTTGARLLGPTLTSTDVARSAWVWGVLGADVRPDGEGLRAVWEDEPIDVLVVPGERDATVGVRFDGAEPLPQDPGRGPAVLATAH